MVFLEWTDMTKAIQNLNKLDVNETTRSSRKIHARRFNEVPKNTKKHKNIKKVHFYFMICILC